MRRLRGWVCSDAVPTGKPTRLPNARAEIDTVLAHSKDHGSRGKLVFRMVRSRPAEQAPREEQRATPTVAETRDTDEPVEGAAPTVAEEIVSEQEKKYRSYPIAGLVPGRRPAEAPDLHEMKKGDDWYARALTGVEQPYPESLRFLEDQGAWYTPFTHPGMTRKYDLRGWY